MIKKTWLGMAVYLLAGGVLVGTAQAQTVDSLDPSNSGINRNYGSSIYTTMPLPNGQILAGGSAVQFISSAGQSHTNLVRLNADGSVDDSFKVTIGYVYCLALQTNGQILVGGNFSAINGRTHNNLGRLNADGTVDTNFTANYTGGSTMSGIPYCILEQPDGKILVAGYFNKVNLQACTGLCRLNGDGSLDTNFNADANNAINALVLQPDGRMVVEGSFTSIGGQLRTNLARLNPDGSLDPGFQPVNLGLLGLPGGTLLRQPDGEILMGGNFSRVDGLSHTNLTRLNADGTVDTNFAAQADASDCLGMQSLTLQTDGRILIGDDSYTLDGQLCPFLGRLNGDGGLDAGFKTNVVGNGGVVYSCAAQSDGRILTAGEFYQLGGQARNGLGRLINTGSATQCLNYDGTNLLWLRGGASPEVWRTSFEVTPDGTNWSYLGDGSRVGGGWQLTNVCAAANARIRARGFVTGGRYNGSSWYVESVYPQTAPVLGTTGGNPGCQNGYNVCGSAGSTVVIDASGDLLNWAPVVTNLLPSGPLPFNEPAATSFSQRFYRARLQP